MNFNPLLLCIGILFSFALNLNAKEQAVSIEQHLFDQISYFTKGHRDFKDLYFKQHEAEFIRLVEKGQSPKMLFIGCSDSRIIPDLFLNTRPGDLFVIRTAGNFIPTASDSQGLDGVSATIQYAVEVLNIPHIIVCGHSHCGAIQALFQHLDSFKLGILQRWLKLGEQAKQMTLLIAKPSTPKEILYTIAEKISVLYQLEHLMTFPFIKKRVDEGTLELHGWYYKIETSELSYFDTTQQRFKPLTESLQPLQIK